MLEDSLKICRLSQGQGFSEIFTITQQMWPQCISAFQLDGKKFHQLKISFY